MKEILKEIRSPLFDGIAPEERVSMLGCIGYYMESHKKGEILAFEEQHIRRVGLVLRGSVDMLKEDVWGNKTLLLRMGKDEIFGESFACGSSSLSLVTFQVSQDAEILFLPFDRVLHSCTMACEFHHRLTENMIRLIADKNQELLRKVEVVSKRTTREKLLTYLSAQAQSRQSRYFEIPLGRTELAEYLCVDRSAMTRELSKMKEEGILDFHRNCFRLH